jgi:hypothetical protein
VERETVEHVSAAQADVVVHAPSPVASSEDGLAAEVEANPHATAALLELLLPALWLLPSRLASCPRLLLLFSSGCLGDLHQQWALLAVCPSEGRLQVALPHPDPHEPVSHASSSLHCKGTSFPSPFPLPVPFVEKPQDFLRDAESAVALEGVSLQESEEGASVGEVAVVLLLGQVRGNARHESRGKW